MLELIKARFAESFSRALSVCAEPTGSFKSSKGTPFRNGSPLKAAFEAAKGVPYERQSSSLILLPKLFLIGAMNKPQSVNF